MEDDPSADELPALLDSGGLTLDMHDYGKMEKAGVLDASLPTNDQQITTQPGDIILYQDNQSAIYYDTNSWSPTKFGRVNNIATTELQKLLGDSDICCDILKTDKIISATVIH